MLTLSTTWREVLSFREIADPIFENFLVDNFKKDAFRLDCVQKGAAKVFKSCL